MWNDPSRISPSSSHPSAIEASVGGAALVAKANREAAPPKFNRRTLLTGAGLGLIGALGLSLVAPGVGRAAIGIHCSEPALRRPAGTNHSRWTSRERPQAGGDGWPPSAAQAESGRAEPRDSADDHESRGGHRRRRGFSGVGSVGQNRRSSRACARHGNGAGRVRIARGTRRRAAASSPISITRRSAG